MDREIIKIEDIRELDDIFIIEEGCKANDPSLVDKAIADCKPSDWRVYRCVQHSAAYPIPERVVLVATVTAYDSEEAVKLVGKDNPINLDTHYFYAERIED